VLKAINPADMEPYTDPDLLGQELAKSTPVYYSQAIEVPAGARMLYSSGLVGMASDGSVAKGMAAQSEQIWINITAVLREAGMTVNDIVKMNVYTTSFDDYAEWSAVRARYLAGHRPAILGVAVDALAVESLLLEVDVVAAAV
jgi:enamine deaminase RidA (YjgF/YER057c/UK114 family)